jgi:hypothetical protein
MASRSGRAPSPNQFDSFKTGQDGLSVPEGELRVVMRGSAGRAKCYLLPMDGEKLLYLVSLCLDRERGNVVRIDVCVSGEPETPAMTNELPLDELNSVFRDFFKTAPGPLRQRTDRLLARHGFTIPMFISEQSMRESGLLMRSIRT